MNIINKKDIISKTLRLVEAQQEISEPGNIRFNFDSNLNRNFCVPRRPDKRGRRDDITSIDLELLFRNSENNRWVEWFLCVWISQSKYEYQKKKNELEDVSDLKEKADLRSTEIFVIVKLKDYNFAGNTLH